MSDLSGLDASSCSQCVAFMKRLAELERRTVICTIHQPSALLLEMFDSLYVVAGGYCIYRGTISSLLPHMASIGANCPPYHNPADFRKYNGFSFDCFYTTTDGLTHTFVNAFKNANQIKTG